ncbi:hypothetical protein SAMN04488066_1023 [Halorubrum aquaticum]|uniref:Uncharacterized protein n=1 Tax=Halorubrum aquaticum TaxID=387340 RepID=A0A1I2ZEB0_9EURY|nr:hypothetical protein [Halorubrum aquaticum]SFH36212.1 hypothetical protein SAMN04488066_1023 [Halorubrum aquaticum]
MAEQPSEEDRTVETADPAVGPADSVAESAAPGVDEDLKRRLREAYLNDEEDALVVTAVRMAGDEVVVETRPPHGETTHVERFDAPRHGSLEECTEFLAFLESAGVSPLDLDDLVGARVPATFDPETGWRVRRASDRTVEGGETGGDAAATDAADADPSARQSVSATLTATAEWLREYRDWVIAVLLVGGELLFIALIVVLFA